jgi:murein DD-endopeptidase MepM/ murein hydrolase activator NlpD
VRLLIALLIAVIAGGILREELERAVPAATAPDDHIAMPIRSIAPRRIASTWKAPRPGNRKHEGQDIFARTGTPVYSATSGIVVRIGAAGIGGNAVWVLGAGGRVYYYAHLATFAPGLRLGERVTPETELGLVGNTGNARTTPPHLHFGIYGPEGPINPLPLLAGPSKRVKSAA